MFKPKDEEAYAPNNPRGFGAPEDSVSFRNGVLSTHQASREVAAYLLDHRGYCNVPMTTLCRAMHENFNNPGQKPVWKIGSLQKYVNVKDTAGNFSPSLF